jgi:hypothetical protein
MEEIFNKLIKLDLAPNRYYLLVCKKDNIAPAFNLNLGVEYMRLQSDGWLDASNQLTSKSVKLIQELDSYFKNSKKKTSTNILGENFIGKIEEYLEIFPKFKLPSGKYARSDKKNLENNFRWFFENHEYDWKTVINATKMYVDDYERQGYKYMRTSQYFIRKLNPAEKTFESELANYCDTYLHGNNEGMNDNHFSERVV